MNMITNSGRMRHLTLSMALASGPLAVPSGLAGCFKLAAMLCSLTIDLLDVVGAAGCRCSLRNLFSYRSVWQFCDCARCLVLTHEAGFFIVELPARNQVLHGDGVVPRTESLGLVQRVGGHDLLHVDLDAEARRRWHVDHAADDLERIAREALPVLPDPVRVDGSDVARRGGGNLREHRQRNVEVVVGMRTPGQAPFVAHLRHRTEP